MLSHDSQQPTPFPYKGHNEGTTNATEMQVVYNYLLHHTASRFMVAIATRIPIQNVCWLVFHLRQANRISVEKYGRCRITGQLVEFLTTDPAKFPKSDQLTLF
jgi:hypothetical protein